MALKQITGKDFKEALDALTPYGEGDVVWLKELGKTDGGTGLYLIVGWTRDLGYELRDVEANGFTGDNDDYIGYKIGYFNYKPGIRYMLQDFDDFHMPYNLKDDKANGIYKGDVWDTDGYLSNEPSSWDSLASQLNNDAQGIWDTWGENGELDLMESKKKEAKKSEDMLSRRDAMEKAKQIVSSLKPSASACKSVGLSLAQVKKAFADFTKAYNSKSYVGMNTYDFGDLLSNVANYAYVSGDNSGAMEIMDLAKSSLSESKQSKGCSMKRKIESLAKKNEGAGDTIKVTAENVMLTVNDVYVDEHGGSFSVETPEEGKSYNLLDMQEMIRGMCEDCTGYANYSRDGSELFIEVMAGEMDDNGEWTGDYYKAYSFRCIARILSYSLEGIIDFLDESN